MWELSTSPGFRLGLYPSHPGTTLESSSEDSPTGLLELEELKGLRRPIRPSCGTISLIEKEQTFGPSLVYLYLKNVPL